MGKLSLIHFVFLQQHCRYLMNLFVRTDKNVDCFTSSKFSKSFLPRAKQQSQKKTNGEKVLFTIFTVMQSNDAIAFVLKDHSISIFSSSLFFIFKNKSIWLRKTLRIFIVLVRQCQSFPNSRILFPQSFANLARASDFFVGWFSHVRVCLFAFAASDDEECRNKKVNWVWLANILFSLKSQCNLQRDDSV